MNNVSFFVKATVNYTDSSRRKGGYFSYSDKKESDCLVAIKGNVATIYTHPISVGYVISFNKLVTGKYFSFTGKKVTEKTFNKHLKERQLKAIQMKAEREAKELSDKMAADQLQEDITNQIKQLLTPEKIQDWTKEGANEGNSHTRRTRWSNRIMRMGFDRGYGSLLRSLVDKASNNKCDFFVNGKYNPQHI